MLIPLTEASTRQLIPAIATGPQYRYCWGQPQDFLRRLLISVILAIGALLAEKILRISGEIALVVGILGGLYWWWGPIVRAAQRNYRLRRYRYAAFWEGEIVDLYRSQTRIGTEETVNSQGRLVLIDKLETRVNVELLDENDFELRLQVPIKNDYKKLRRGQLVQLLLFSNDPQLSKLEAYSDAYVPALNLWVSDYPYLSREAFKFTSARLISETEAARYDDRGRRRR